jgi:hypothetical protein
MRLILKIIIILLLLISVLGGVLYATNLGYLNPLVRYTFQLYLKYHGMDSKVGGLVYKDGTLYSDAIFIKNLDAEIRIKKFKADIRFLEEARRTIEVDLSAGSIILANREGLKVLETDFSGKYRSALFSDNTHAVLNFPNIKIGQIQNMEGKILQDGTAKVEYSAINGLEKHDLNLKFGEKSYLNLSATLGEQAGITADMENFPLMLYEFGCKLAPRHDICTFLEDFIKSGFIVKGNIALNLKSKITNSTEINKENLRGNFKIKNLNIQYDKDLPQVKNIDTDVTISGSQINFHVNEGYSSRMKLYDGDISLNWQGVDNTRIVISAKGKGPASDLTDFIPEASHAGLQKSGINLREFTGNTEAVIKIIIPLKPGTTNIYDITAEVPFTGISIFKKQINLTKTSLTGKFDGSSVVLAGKGKINGYNSDLNFNYKINEEGEDDYRLNIRTYFRTNPNKNKHQKIGFISFLKGNSYIDLLYKNKDSKGIIEIISDLKDLELYFDKLGIHKQQGETGKFVLNGEFKDANIGKIRFGVLGENNLDIQGDMAISDKVTEIIFPKIKHKQTDLTAKIKLIGEMFDGSIKGKVLDLSNADMLQFLGKERDSGTTKLKMAIDQVRLKSDIWLTNLKLKFECDKDRCSSGYIDSKIGTKSLELLLTAKGTKGEEWVLNCSNAGALLKGLGAYDSMRAGNLSVSVNTSRGEVKSGEIIPIFNGNFNFERFVLHDAPALSRLVSLVSLPGFVSMITNNKDIVFSQMIGNFSFSNRSLVISKGMAKGPYFDFTIGGNIDTENRQMKLHGYVTPALYGISKIVGTIPLLGKIITGDKKHGGLITAPFKIDQKY